MTNLAVLVVVGQTLNNTQPTPSHPTLCSLLVTSECRVPQPQQPLPVPSLSPYLFEQSCRPVASIRKVCLQLLQAQVRASCSSNAQMLRDLFQGSTTGAVVATQGTTVVTVRRASPVHT